MMTITADYTMQSNEELLEGLCADIEALQDIEYLSAKRVMELNRRIAARKREIMGRLENS